NQRRGAGQASTSGGGAGLGAGLFPSPLAGFEKCSGQIWICEWPVPASTSGAVLVLIPSLLSSFGREIVRVCFFAIHWNENDEAAFKQPSRELCVQARLRTDGPGLLPPPPVPLDRGRTSRVVLEFETGSF